MAATTTGEEFKRFLKDQAYWTKNAFYDDDVIVIDGVPQISLDIASIADHSHVVIEEGIVFTRTTDVDGIAFDLFFKRWLVKQSTRTFVVEVGADKVDAVVEAIKTAGGTVR